MDQETQPPDSQQRPDDSPPELQQREEKLKTGDPHDSGRKKKEKEGSWVRENVEAVIIAIVLALIIRQFAMEAFVIPTGSMAPTLYGEHVEITCPNCSRRFAIDNPDKGGRQDSFDRAYRRVAECPRCKSRDVVYLYDAGEWSDNTEALCQTCAHRWVVENPTSGRMVLAKRVSLHCPNCEFEFQKDITPSDTTGGHKILVNKAGLLVRSPKRWDVIVFKYPEDTTKNYIKRLIGLPNENLLISDGDIYVNGEIARKELGVIRAMSYEIFSSEFHQKWEENIPWRSYSDDWKLSVESLDVKAHEDESLVEFDRRITSALPYSSPDSNTPVNDVGFRFSATCASEGELFCAIDDGERAFRLHLPVGSEGRASLTMDDIELATADLRLAPGKRCSVEFVNTDDRILALVDGEEIFRHDYESEISLSQSAEISLGTVRTAARFEKIHVYRDIYYTCDGEYAVGSPKQLGPEEYFALGDNSASSKDSRRWGTVPAQNMLGRGFIIFWPIPQIRFIK